jgi:hypothetical protein
MQNRRSWALVAPCLGMLFVFAGRAHAVEVEQWDVWEILLEGPRDGVSHLDVELSGTFHQSGNRIVVPGFCDGDGVYKVRFSPPTQGEWRYETRSNRPSLHGKTGSFTAGPPSSKNHGPIQVFKTFYLRYADGTAYHQFGTTCYAWIHQTEELQQQTLKTLAASPFNKIRFCIFPKSYAYNVGPVAGDIGPLVIGNFNETRHSYGLDRQFRGQIRGLEIYGSRISGRGALTLEEIE